MRAARPHAAKLQKKPRARESRALPDQLIKLFFIGILSVRNWRMQRFTALSNSSLGRSPMLILHAELQLASGGRNAQFVLLGPPED
jgi:hypothetical protein